MTGGNWNLNTTIAASGALAVPLGAGSVPYNRADNDSASLAYGTGAGTMSILVISYRPLPAGASETLNLYDGSLLDVFGGAAGFRVLRAVAVLVISGGDTSGVTVGNAASNANTLFMGGTTPTHTIYPSGPPFMGGSPVGIAVTSSACNVKVVNNGASPVLYAIYLAGSQAVTGVAMGTMGLTYP